VRASILSKFMFFIGFVNREFKSIIIGPIF